MTKPASMTPLMQQYWKVKTAHPDKIVLFRMGDFFEMFHEDAETAAPLLGIALTQRNKKSGDQTPMCGVPHHSIAEKINRLLAEGLKVAICDQVEDPKLAKGLVKREVTRILSPGMVYDPDTLISDKAHYLCAWEKNHIAFLDATTGEAFYYDIDHDSQREHLWELLSPVEMVVSSEQKESLSPQELSSVISVFDLDPSGNNTVHEPMACQRLRAYGLSMQGPTLAGLLTTFERRSYQGRMRLSATALKHLEIFHTYNGDTKGSLFDAIKRTKTSGGARLLRSWLAFPLMSSELIKERQQRIGFWLSEPEKLKSVRQRLGEMGDLERRWGKLTQPQFSPQELGSLQSSLEVALSLHQIQPLVGISDVHIRWAQEWTQRIASFLVDEIPAQFKNGQFVREGYSGELDKWITLATKSQTAVMALETKEKSLTGIPSLKVRYNNVFGYYIEITNTHKDKVPLDRYQRKQTLAGAERYTTDELVELEKQVLQARTRRVEMELSLFESIKQELLQGQKFLRDWADAVSTLDVVSSLAHLSLERGYCVPEIVSADEGLTIRMGRHPVVEQSLKRGAFIGNDLELRPGEGLLITGPNMAGKSTYMRQVALICLMAQMGSHVPADSAKIPLLENISTRVGSSDSLTEGLSTFMVEMTETAEMLRQAGPRSLVILDEVGRGTSTYDGLSLAQAILEHLLQHTGAYTLFATHYHELTELPKVHPNLKNVHMAVIERSGEIKFLYSVVKGPAQKSFGVQVARLAGLPTSVTERARSLLRDFERGVHYTSASDNLEDLPLFRAGDLLNSAEKNAVRRLKSLNINGLTPLQALNELNLLKSTLDQGSGDSTIESFQGLEI